MIKISNSMNNVALLILITVGITCATQEIIEAMRATQNSYSGNRAGLSRYGVYGGYILLNLAIDRNCHCKGGLFKTKILVAASAESLKIDQLMTYFFYWIVLIILLQ